jgi:hypothetical protein
MHFKDARFDFDAVSWRAAGCAPTLEQRGAENFILVTRFAVWWLKEIMRP